MPISRLLLENVRCFAGCNVVPIRPLTLLIGENSSGKTSLLTALGAYIGEKLSFPFSPDFNTPPFQLGRFEDIVTHTSGEQEDFFSIGIEVTPGGYPGFKFPLQMISRFRNDNGRAVLETFAFHAPRVILGVMQEEGRWMLIRRFSRDEQSELKHGLDDLADPAFLARRSLHRTELIVPMEVFRTVPLEGAIYYLLHEKGKRNPKYQDVVLRDLRFPLRIPPAQSEKSPRSYHLAPIRAMPQRTYESYGELITPEGGHVPFVIERQSRLGSQLIKSLRRFGKASGLFSGVSVRRFGEPRGSRFVINMRVGGFARNILDVGYGVAQVLPPVVDSLRLPNGSFITLQQPEVHLHPRAQAELGSFFCALVANDHKTFLIETHSDYLVDRIRTEVRKGRLSHDAVVICFLELKKGVAVIHNVLVGPDGSLVDPPQSYSEFFIEEALSVLE